MNTPTPEEMTAVIDALQIAHALDVTDRYLAQHRAMVARIRTNVNAFAVRHGLDAAELWEYVTRLSHTTCLDLEGAYRALEHEYEDPLLNAALVELSLTGEVTIPIPPQPDVPKDTPSHWPKDVTAAHERRQSRRERLRDQPWRKGHA